MIVPIQKCFCCAELESNKLCSICDAEICDKCSHTAVVEETGKSVEICSWCNDREEGVTWNGVGTKKHDCIVCGGEIQPGERFKERTWVDDSVIMKVWIHPECYQEWEESYPEEE